MNFRDMLIKLAAVAANPETDFLMRLADAVAEPEPDLTHELLVACAAQSQQIMDDLGANRRILAIKELRFAKGCSLKQAVNAVDAIRLPTPPDEMLADPWGIPSYTVDTDSPF